MAGFHRRSFPLTADDSPRVRLNDHTGASFDVRSTRAHRRLATAPARVHAFALESTMVSGARYCSISAANRSRARAWRKRFVDEPLQPRDAPQLLVASSPLLDQISARALPRAPASWQLIVHPLQL